MSSSPFQQLLLPVSVIPELQLDQSYLGPNAWLAQWIESQSFTEPLNLFLHGIPGSGLSHWLQAIYRQAEQQQVAAVLVDLSDPQLSADMMAGLECFSLVIFDNLQVVIEQADWQQALFHLFNRVRDSGHSWIAGCHQSLHDLTHILPDLHSRLSWGLVSQIKLPQQDEDWFEVLRFLTEQRGMVISDESLLYLISRMQRSWSACVDIIGQLDRVSLEKQRKISRPLIKEVMGW